MMNLLLSGSGYWMSPVPDSEFLEHVLDVAKETRQVIGRSLRAQDLLIGRVVDELIVEFGDEGTRLACRFLAPFHAL